MSTRSPFRRRQTREEAQADYPGQRLYERSEITPRRGSHREPPYRDPRRQRLMATCPNCGHAYSFEAQRMNNGGMFQLDAGDDQCPSCGTEPEEVYAISPEAYKVRGPRLEIAPPPTQERITDGQE